MIIIFSYGGGRQTVAMCILIAKGLLPRPDVVVMADTSRENPMTWEYMQKYTSPLLATINLEINIASHDLATVGLYGLNGDLLIPSFTDTGKLSGFCSNEWKKRVVDRWLRKNDITGGVKWLGLAHDEQRRWRKHRGKVDGKWTVECPLVDLMLNTDACLKVITNYGWPEPHQSSCWMCPHKRNAEWRVIRDKYPNKWEAACTLDEETREDDDRGGVYLHRSLVPLREANIEDDESAEVVRQCSLGICFV